MFESTSNFYNSLLLTPRYDGIPLRVCVLISLPTSSSLSNIDCLQPPATCYFYHVNTLPQTKYFTFLN